jgi:hypothetical protein
VPVHSDSTLLYLSGADCRKYMQKFRPLTATFLFIFQPASRNGFLLSSRKPVCLFFHTFTIWCSKTSFACLHLFTFLLQTGFPYIDSALEEIAKTRLAQVSLLPFNTSLITLRPSHRLFVPMLQISTACLAASRHLKSKCRLTRRPWKILVIFRLISRRWKQLGLVRLLVHATCCTPA